MLIGGKFCTQIAISQKGNTRLLHGLGGLAVALGNQKGLARTYDCASGLGYVPMGMIMHRTGSNINA